MVKRATGANTKFAGKFEAEYGKDPGGNYKTMRFFTFGLGKDQPLVKEPLLGAGRDPSPPSRGAIDVSGSGEAPVDQRQIGELLTLLLGATQSDAQVGSRGFIRFLANPSDGDTITLGGATWTFVDLAPSGNETLIGANLEATLDQLVTDLEASADGDVSACSYSRLGDRLVIEHDTADDTGDSFALGASNSAQTTLSGSTLVGGGMYKHVWHTGATSLPSWHNQRENPDLDAGAKKFKIHGGVMLNSMAIRRERSGAAKASCEFIGQTETKSTSSVAGTPTEYAMDLFSQFQGYIFADGYPIANLTGGGFSLSNQLDPVPELNEDGVIGGADPGETDLGLDLDCRYSDNVLKKKAEAMEALAIHFGFRDAGGAELLFELHELHLPEPRDEINGPGGIQVTYQAMGARKLSLGRAGTVTLINDVASY